MEEIPNPAKYCVDVSDVPNLTPERIATLIHNATAQAGLSSKNHTNLTASTTPPTISEPVSTQPLPPQVLKGTEAEVQKPQF